MIGDHGDPSSRLQHLDRLREHLLQRVDVGAFQLLQLPPLQDQPRQLVVLGELLEHVRRGRCRARLRVAAERRPGSGSIPAFRWTDEVQPATTVCSIAPKIVWW